MSDKSSLDKLRELTVVQRESGNWNFDPYMHGMANGMEMALAIMEDREPDYLEAPERWLCDLPKPNAEASRCPRATTTGPEVAASAPTS